MYTPNTPNAHNIRARETVTTEKARDCVTWLKQFLSAGWVPCDEVRAAAIRAGFSKRELLTARTELRVISGSVTTWQLPEEKNDGAYRERC